MKKKIFAGILAGIIGISSVALAENEATFNFGTGVLNIPKVDVGSVYYNVEMQQQGQGLDFSVTGAMASTSSSTVNVAIYNPSTGDLNIPTVIVGIDSYNVDMAQGQGLNFSVTAAEPVAIEDPIIPQETGACVDNADGTVVKNGLTWQQADDGVTRMWDEANNYCLNLSLDGGGWRCYVACPLSQITGYGCTFRALVF